MAGMGVLKIAFSIMGCLDDQLDRCLEEDAADSSGDRAVVIDIPATAPANNANNATAVDKNKKKADKKIPEQLDPAKLGEGTCTVCLERFSGSSIKVLDRCKHKFHKDCLDKWLQKNKTCPICRDAFP